MLAAVGFLPVCCLLLELFVISLFSMAFAGLSTEPSPFSGDQCFFGSGRNEWLTARTRLVGGLSGKYYAIDGPLHAGAVALAGGAGCPFFVRLVMSLPRQAFSCLSTEASPSSGDDCRGCWSMDGVNTPFCKCFLDGLAKRSGACRFFISGLASRPAVAVAIFSPVFCALRHVVGAKRFFGLIHKNVHNFCGKIIFIPNGFLASAKDKACIVLPVF